MERSKYPKLTIKSDGPMPHQTKVIALDDLVLQSVTYLELTMDMVSGNRLKVEMIVGALDIDVGIKRPKIPETIGDLRQEIKPKRPNPTVKSI
jgi:hypothetical protein